MRPDEAPLRFVGVDLAWGEKSKKSNTGLAAIAWTGESARLIFAEAEPTGIDALVARIDDLGVIHS